MNDLVFWLPILVNGGFALYFFNRLIKVDYEEYLPFVYYFDGFCFSLNFAVFLVMIL